MRLAGSAELTRAIELLGCEPAQAQELTRLALAQRPPGGVWIACEGKRLLTAVLCLVSPGKTMLLFLPEKISGAEQQQLIGRLVERACGSALSEQVHLAQALLDPDQVLSQSLLEQCSFAALAELLYLQCPIRRAAKAPSWPGELKLTTYSPATHAVFAQAILSSYRNSLDCPGLNGLRDIGDIVSGHRATGEFDPRLWFAVQADSVPAGVLLLNRLPNCQATELVYLGVAPEFRGRGIGDLLMRHAAAATSNVGGERISLAVDAANLPALRLYWRHGFQAFGRKLAMLRDLRKVKLTLGPAAQQRIKPAADRAEDVEPTA